MWTDVGELRLREVYHHLLTPPRAAKVVARVMTANTRVFQFSMLSSYRGRGGQRLAESITRLGDTQEF
jgi:hypothetical protein